MLGQETTFPALEFTRFAALFGALSLESLTIDYVREVDLGAR